MPLFGFSDITFNKNSTTKSGPLAALVGSEFQSSTYRYPLDLGNYDKGHYMVFYVRQQKKTSFKSRLASEGSIDSAGSVSTLSIPNLNANSLSFGNELSNALNNGLSQLGGALNGLTSKLGFSNNGKIGNIGNIFGNSNVTFGGNSAATQQIIDNSIKNITDKNATFRTTQLTTDAIALYMPDTLSFTYTQNYEDISIGGELGGKGLAAVKSALDQYEKGGGSAAAASIAKSAVLSAGQAAIGAAGEALGSTGTARLASAALLGAVANPMLEMIYQAPNFRTFQFDFMFYPRDEKEALEVQRIIERFRFHQAPELLEGAQGFLVPPSEFDIRFYYGGAQNPNIPQIATCVLTSIDTNYAPNGWASYEIPGESRPAIGRTGMPVAIQLSLQFKETTYLTKQDFKSSATSGSSTSTRTNRAVNGSISGGR